MGVEMVFDIMGVVMVIGISVVGKWLRQSVVWVVVSCLLWGSHSFGRSLPSVFIHA